jgi:hypothetical protein
MSKLFHALTPMQWYQEPWARTRRPGRLACHSSLGPKSKTYGLSQYPLCALTGWYLGTEANLLLTILLTTNYMTQCISPSKVEGRQKWSLP